MSAAPSALRGEGSLTERPSGGIKERGSVPPVLGGGLPRDFRPLRCGAQFCGRSREALQALLLSASGGRVGPCPLGVFCSSFVNILLHSQVPSCQKYVLILGVSPGKVSKTDLEGKSHLLFLEEKSSTQNRFSSFSPRFSSPHLLLLGAPSEPSCAFHTLNFTHLSFPSSAILTPMLVSPPDVFLKTA